MEAELGTKHIVSIFGDFHKKKSETFACEMSQDFFTKNAKTCVLVPNAAYTHLGKAKLQTASRLVAVFYGRLKFYGSYLIL